MARRPTAQERRIAALAKTLEPKVRDAFILALQTAATSVDKDALIRALDARDLVLAAQILGINAQTLFPVTEVVRSAYIQGGASVAASIPVALRGQFGFGGNPRAVAAVQAVTADLTQYLIQSTADGVRSAVVRAVNEGIPTRKLATELVGLMDKRTGLRTGGIMGLDDQRAAQAARVREMLGDKDLIRKYFIKDRKTGVMKPRYSTTDRRYDKRVRDAINEGRALSKADIDIISNRHNSRLLANRATQIAHDNTLTSLRAGQNDGFRELIDSGAVLDEQLERTWVSGRDKITRPDHVEMDGTVVRGAETAYSLPDGSRALYPGDRSLGAPIEQTTFCRCVEVVRIIPRSKLEEPAL